MFRGCTGDTSTRVRIPPYPYRTVRGVLFDEDLISHRVTPETQTKELGAGWVQTTPIVPIGVNASSRRFLDHLQSDRYRPLQWTPTPLQCMSSPNRVFSRQRARSAQSKENYRVAVHHHPQHPHTIPHLPNTNPPPHRRSNPSSHLGLGQIVENPTKSKHYGA